MNFNIIISKIQNEDVYVVIFNLEMIIRLWHVIIEIIIALSNPLKSGKCYLELE